ncbi:hypothetical protein B0T25DRAFT_545750 [Lasiosphaeria hispida]|uniref:Uncharacterized protein n=1 Tax=Lasiosphaeria hispida TaxID=260671 RepID=A0AAJ0HJY4_9PEZI|nr:hypothetical protein B0T25DRAFT_545750 [Lasiosphaeria hispida]
MNSRIIASTTPSSISGTSGDARGRIKAAAPIVGWRNTGGLGAGSPIIVKGKAPVTRGGGLTSRSGINKLGSMVPSGTGPSGISDVRSLSGISPGYGTSTCSCPGRCRARGCGFWVRRKRELEVAVEGGRQIPPGLAPRLGGWDLTIPVLESYGGFMPGTCRGRSSTLRDPPPWGLGGLEAWVEGKNRRTLLPRLQKPSPKLRRNLLWRMVLIHH